ncbi:MAG: hypothetical protein QGG54_06335 [Gammaproteobacteria bacterium]|nr:hypothetical protein [Gammaproteobacteria bacterium]
MKKITLSVVPLLLLVACVSTPNFNRMSNDEIAEYNQTASTWDQVICREQKHVRSRIPRRRCQTRLAWQQGVIGDVEQMATADPGQQKIGVDF